MILFETIRIRIFVIETTIKNRIVWIIICYLQYKLVSHILTSKVSYTLNLISFNIKTQQR